MQKIHASALSIEASKKASELVDAKSAKAPEDFHWAIAFADGRLAVVANSEKGYELAIKELFTTYIRNGMIIVKSNLVAEGTLTYADYKAELDEAARQEAEAKKEANQKILDELMPKVIAQRNSLSNYMGKINPYNVNDSKIYLFKQYTKNIGTSSWGASPVKPTSDQHPRLLVAEDMLPDLRISLDQDNAFTKRFFELLDAAESLRMLDFLNGVTYSTDGEIKNVSKSTYIITPNNVDVSDH